MAKGKALTRWDEELAKEAQAASDSEKMPSGNFVSIRGGKLTIAGQPVRGNELNVLILDYIYENAYYEGRFDPDAPSSPVCFAFGRSEDELAPHDDSTAKQNEQCNGCPQNVFGSDERGKGKACKNGRRLALLSADKLSEESIAKGDIMFLKVPPTSLKGWAYFVKALAATYRRPPHGMIAKLRVEPDEKTQVKVIFEPVEPVDVALLSAVKERQAEVRDAIAFPYQPRAELPAPAPRRAAGKLAAPPRRKH